MAKYLRLDTWSAAGEKTKTLWSVIGLCLAILPKKEASDFNGQRPTYWLKSGNFVPVCCLAGVRGSRTHLPRSSRGITDLKCVAIRTRASV
jgi:hypothetical protein